MALIGKRRRSPEDVLRAINEQAGEFTSRDIIESLKWDHVEDITFVGNKLRSFARQGVIEEAGKVEAKGQGRRRLLWRKVGQPGVTASGEPVSETGSDQAKEPAREVADEPAGQTKAAGGNS